MADEIRFRRQIEDIGYSILYHVLTLDKELSDRAFRLYSLLLKYAQQKGRAWPGVERLAEDLGKTDRAVKAAMAELVKRGLVSRQRRFGTSTITYIEDPNDVYGDLLVQMCEGEENFPTDGHEGEENFPTGEREGEENFPTDEYEGEENFPTKGKKTSPKEEEEKNNKRGEEEEEKEPVHLSENEEKEAIWQAALGELRLQMTKATFDTWVRNTRLVACQDNVFVISAPDEFSRDWLENRLGTTVERTLVGIIGRQVSVKFVVEGCIT